MVGRTSPNRGWLDILGLSFLGLSAETDYRDAPRSPGLAPHINLHENQTVTFFGDLGVPGWAV